MLTIETGGGRRLTGKDPLDIVLQMMARARERDLATYVVDTAERIAAAAPGCALSLSLPDAGKPKADLAAHFLGELIRVGLAAEVLPPEPGAKRGSKPRPKKPKGSRPKGGSAPRT